MSEKPSDAQETGAVTPSIVKKGGASESLQVLVVAVVAAAIGVGGYSLMHRGAPGADGAQQVRHLGGLPDAAGSAALGQSPSTGFVVIDSDRIASSALRAVQQAFQSNPSILPHLGEVGRIVGADIQAQARTYVSQGLLVYNASGLLGYPASADRTQAVERRVMADVQANVQHWIATAPTVAQTASEPALPAPSAAPGFEP